MLSLLLSIVLPHSLAQHAGEAVVATLVKPLHAARLLLLPVLGVLHATDGLVRKAANKTAESASEDIEDEIEAEILSLAEEGGGEGRGGRARARDDRGRSSASATPPWGR